MSDTDGIITSDPNHTADAATDQVPALTTDQVASLTTETLTTEAVEALAPVAEPAVVAERPRSLSDIEHDLAVAMADVGSWVAGEYEAAKAKALEEFETTWRVVRDTRTETITALATELAAAHAWWSDEIAKIKAIF